MSTALASILDAWTLPCKTFRQCLLPPRPCASLLGIQVVLILSSLFLVSIFSAFWLRSRGLCFLPLGSIPGSGRSPGEGNGDPLHYSCLENPMDRGAWYAAVYRVVKSQTQLSD